VNARKIGGIGAVTAAVFAAGLWAAVGSAGWLASSADPVNLRASLGAAAEVPKPTGVGRNASGSFAATLNRNGSRGQLAWRLTFRGLTGRASAAHIHLGRPGVAGNVAVPLCAPCRSGVKGTARVNARTMNALLGGSAYVNVHTARNAAGEVRGQVRKGGSGVSGGGGTGTGTGTGTTDTMPPTYPPDYPS
jgi:CHRD domain